MIGKAEKCQSSRNGIYLLQPNPVNGYPCWKDASGKNAIWHEQIDSNWDVGDLDNIGSKRATIYYPSPDEIDGWPTNLAPKWKFLDGGKWQEAGNDIIFEDCTPSVSRVPEQAPVTSRKMFNLFKIKK